MCTILASDKTRIINFRVRDGPTLTALLYTHFRDGKKSESGSLVGGWLQSQNSSNTRHAGKPRKNLQHAKLGRKNTQKHMKATKTTSFRLPHIPSLPYPVFLLTLSSFPPPLPYPLLLLILSYYDSFSPSPYASLYPFLRYLSFGMVKSRG